MNQFLRVSLLFLLIAGFGANATEPPTGGYVICNVAIPLEDFSEGDGIPSSAHILTCTRPITMAPPERPAEAPPLLVPYEMPNYSDPYGKYITGTQQY